MSAKAWEQRRELKRFRLAVRRVSKDNPVQSFWYQGTEIAVVDYDYWQSLKEQEAAWLGRVRSLRGTDLGSRAGIETPKVVE